MRALIPVAALLVGCGSNTSGDAHLLVAAASDLSGVMPALAAAFEAAHGVPVVATMGSSGQLAQQILQGAPVDVFLSADAGSVDQLEARGRLEPGTRAVYAIGSLVLLAGRISEPPETLGAVAETAYARVALANPDHAPYGAAARQALEAAGILEAVAGRLVIAENVRQTVQFAETRSVDVAIAALSLMDSTRHRWTVVPAGAHEPLAQTAAVIAGRPQTASARAFVGFLTGEQGREILARHRFTLP
ncbi:MAG TPA: molybdate ABC transporter substrate-binding protein [Longimicrobiales bacterium]|nr:molybdate ABC transporter substrate-binding protein [Longimicrobiales bacterium]